SGWTLDFDYQAWANSKTFKVGDNLVFNYPQGAHDVVQVADDAFANCIIPPGKIAHTSGHDIIELSSPGKEYFICGVSNHCATFNQKLAVDVKA
ncbi:plastocyanin-like protein, partial [Tanacetum coccineum]